MFLRDALRIPASEITDEPVYRDRRRVLAALAALPALSLAGCSDAAPPPPAKAAPIPEALAKAERSEIPVYIPRLSLSTDNAAMIAAAGLRQLAAGKFAAPDLNAAASLPL